MTAPRTLNSPDPTNAINALFWALHNARQLGFSPRTEHELAEQLLRGSVRILYYSSAGSTVSWVEGRDAGDDDFDEQLAVLELLAKRKRRQREESRAAEQVAQTPAEGAPA